MTFSSRIALEAWVVRQFEAVGWGVELIPEETVSEYKTSTIMGDE